MEQKELEMTEARETLRRLEYEQEQSKKLQELERAIRKEEEALREQERRKHAVPTLFGGSSHHIALAVVLLSLLFLSRF